MEPYDEMSKGWRVIILKKRREEINAKQREQMQKDMEKEMGSPE